jgi:hypothetical protein
LLRYNEAAVWITASAILRGRQKPRTDGHGAISQKLLKAANKITLNKQTPAIAKRKLTMPIRPLKSQRTGEHVCSKRETQKHHHAVV